jgi:hypothetical protein
MAIVNKSDLRLPPDRVIDLGEPQGNAFFLLGLASNLSKQLKLDAKKVDAEMKAGDYENLITVFDGYFGSIYTLVRAGAYDEIVD